MWIWLVFIQYFPYNVGKVKVKVKFTQEQAMKAQRVSRGIALLFLNLGARSGWVSNVTPRRFTPGKDAVTIV
jgi:hypothetical protein